MLVGGTDTVVAQATLANPEAVAPGTAAMLPVTVQAQNAACSIEPNAAQQSGAIFVAHGITPGTCSVTAQADVTTEAGALSDSLTLAIGVLDLPTPSPPPQSCDFQLDARCYHRFIDRTTATFWKSVIPDVACMTTDGAESCHYIDAIQQILITPGFYFSPPFVPDAQHPIVIKVDWIASVDRECEPYSFFANLPGGDAIQWENYAIGAPVDGPDGLGEPSRFIVANYVVDASLTNVSAPQRWTSDTTFLQLFNSVATRTLGNPQVFLFSTSAASATTLQWIPDFPACDAFGAPDAPQREYGNAGVTLVFEIYQAMN